ncbi:hypothetical protein C2845_PM13G18000 [Panicum miliaceum]|uniref:NAC domain-containing protein n=1 Tax=Panicum miliaceum TaxID=4540 RepID=A0A3L6RLL2_PANMI|nr:hypothetical protein C2845_PM13G18000 [Panicum miliaceum]
MSDPSQAPDPPAGDPPAPTTGRRIPADESPADNPHPPHPKPNHHPTIPTLSPLLCRGPPRVPPASARAPTTRPGATFQDLLLRDFYCNATPSSSSSGSLWLTPSPSSPSLSSFQVINIVNFNLTSPPVFLRAVSPQARVFRVRVASPNVAMFISLRGTLTLASSAVRLHGSFLEVSMAASALGKADEAFTAFLTPAPTEPPAVTLLPSNGSSAPPSCPPFADCSPFQDSPERKRSAYLLVLNGPDRHDLPPLLPLPSYPERCEGACDMIAPSGALEPNAVPALLSPLMPTTKPYLQAVLSPSAPPRPISSRLIFKPPPNACLRCLASDHHISSCELQEGYFFCTRGSKYLSGVRARRATRCGYWKSTGKDKAVHGRDGRLVGRRKTLVFNCGRAPRGQKTGWAMHEYAMAHSEWVICKVFMRKHPRGDERKVTPEEAVHDQDSAPGHLLPMEPDGCDGHEQEAAPPAVVTDSQHTISHSGAHVMEGNEKDHINNNKNTTKWSMRSC